jgi:NADH:ubiquinone oxidoreductase subunit
VGPYLLCGPTAESVIALYTNKQRAKDKTILPVIPENIPEELKVRPQWVVWRAVGEKPDKVPYSARTGRKASSTNLT